jgi:hypothetical protein
MKAQSVGGGWSGIVTGYPLVLNISIKIGVCLFRGDHIATFSKHGPPSLLLVGDTKHLSSSCVWHSFQGVLFAFCIELHNFALFDCMLLHVLIGKNKH